MIKAIIFDMDGTALDSMGNWKRIRLDYLKELGMDFDHDEQAKIQSLNWNESVNYINSLKGTNIELKAFEDGILETQYNQYKHTSKLKPGFIGFLDYLDSQNIKYCIATASRYYGAEYVFERFGLMDRIQFIITVGTVANSKHFPDIYLEAAKRLGLKPSEILVFEDALYAIKTAKDAGFATVAIKDDFYIDDHSEIKNTSDLMVKDFIELLNLIEAKDMKIKNIFEV